MLKGLSLTQLAERITANAAMKHDLVAPASSLVMLKDDDGKLLMGAPTGHAAPLPGRASFPILGTAHDQISARLEIPGRYYGRMLAEAPALLRENVNEWLGRSSERRMVRTLGGDMRAFLSDRYQRIENEEIANVALPVLLETPGIRVVSCEITERRMHILAVTNRIQGEVKVGDVVEAGVSISNSEIGAGAVAISPLIWRLICLNGMKVPDSRFQARHVGRQIQEGADLNAIFADDTRKADDRAILLKVRDVVRAALDEVRFGETLDRMKGLTEGRVTGDPTAAVEVLARKVGASEMEKGGILRALIEGSDLSAWGLLNAVTAQAHTAASYDRAVEFTEAGGKLLTLPKGEWKEILEAA